MKNSKVVCVDFGSAYTKIAVRPGWDDAAGVVQGLREAVEEPSFCIPSVVARVERSTGTRWEIGRDAAATEESKQIRVYRHWKAGLFSNNPTTGTASDDSPYEIGVQFFKKMRTILRKSPILSKLGDCPVRVCVPRLHPGRETEAEVMKALLAKAGWQVADGRPVVYEPESNVCGVFTRGQNATWFPPKSPTGQRIAFFPRMFERAGIMSAFQSAASRGTDAKYGVLVTDIGAFTTDFGYVNFDQSFYDEDAPRPDVVQRSYEVGVAELDKAVRSRFPASIRDALERLPVLEWESVKRLLYAGEEAAVTTPSGIIELGHGPQRDAVSEEVDAFVQRVITAMKKFRNSNFMIHAHVITGGGSLIPTVRETLLHMLGTDGCRVYDLLDQNEHKNALLATFDKWSGRPTYNMLDVEARRRQSRDLVRAGSALGGASVFFE